MDIIKDGDTLLVIWGTDAPSKELENTINELKTRVGDSGHVQVEHSSILVRSSHSSSVFDTVLSGTLTPFHHTASVLSEILKILKPNGFLNFKDGRNFEALQSTLILAGFTNIQMLNNEECTEIICQKPSFEVGKSSKLPLSFAKKKTNKDEIKKIWTLTNDDINDGEVDIIDSDILLKAEDLKKPDLSTVKTDCGTNKAGKRKACKGCTCGLAEELETGVKVEQKSACGSCYLGDAFRCASCPYLGMPPFKPGEKISLSDRQLNPDT